MKDPVSWSSFAIKCGNYLEFKHMKAQGNSLLEWAASSCTDRYCFTGTGSFPCTCYVVLQLKRQYTNSLEAKINLHYTLYLKSQFILCSKHTASQL